MAAFGQTLEAIGELRSTRPTEMALLLFEVRTHNALGAAWLKSGDFPHALESHRQAQQLLASATPSRADEQKLRYAQSLTLAALVLTRSAEFIHQQEHRGPRRPGQDARPTASPDIQDEFRQALQLLEGLLKIDPQNADYLVRSSPMNRLFQISLARVRWQLADSLQRQDSLRPARELLEQAIAQYSKFRDSKAGHRASTGLLVGLYRQLARTLEQLGEEQLASEASRTADRLRDLSR